LKLKIVLDLQPEPPDQTEPMALATGV